MPTFKTERAALEARRDELLARLVAIDAALASRTARDREGTATERAGDAVREGMGASGRAARRRIGTGDDGFCLRCGKAIAPDRAAAVPEAPLWRGGAG
jgi:RNA polymerase-binding transcription factor DksA